MSDTVTTVGFFWHGQWLKEFHPNRGFIIIYNSSGREVLHCVSVKKVSGKQEILPGNEFRHRGKNSGGGIVQFVLFKTALACRVTSRTVTESLSKQVKHRYI